MRKTNDRYFVGSSYGTHLVVVNFLSVACDYELVLVSARAFKILHARRVRYPRCAFTRLGAGLVSGAA